MKRFLFFILLTSLFLCSCKFSFAENDTVSSEKTNEVSQSSSVADNPAGKNKVYITLNKSSARTALPTIDWAGTDDGVPFTFSLTVIQNPNESTQKAPVVLFQNRPYNELGTGFELESGKYKFVLDAFKKEEKSMSGELIYDLSTGNSTLNFLMLPVSGSKGSASIKITFPYDETVGSVKAAVCSDIFISPDSITTEDISSKIKVVSGKKVLTYEKTELASNAPAFAHFWFYDAAGSLIYSGLESIIVVGGCVSYSEIVLTSDDWHTYLCTVTLQKNDAGWAFSGKSVSLVDKSKASKVYKMSERTEGKFTASVAEGLYNIYVNKENTEVEFNSVNETAVVDYYSVSMAPVKCCTMVPVSGGIYMADNQAIVQKDKDFVYRVNLSQGYEVSGTLVLKQNDSAIENPVLNEEITILTVKASYTVSVEGISPVVYSINYNDMNKYYDGIESTEISYWFDNDAADKKYNPPVTFTAEDIIELPSILNVRKNGSYFDAWLDGTEIVKNTEGVYKNLILTPVWKKAPTIYEETGAGGEEVKIVYANGFNLLITGDTATTNNATYIYVDYNGDGIKNNDDWQLKRNNDSYDFSGFELRAGNPAGDEIKSDFVFTMTGGIISSIYGLNSRTERHLNKSTLNISGTSVIGSIGEKKTKTITEDYKKTYAANVSGIWLETLSDERVNIVGKMNNYVKDGVHCNYQVTCITPYAFERDENENEIEHVIAYISNSNYATFNNFTCWTQLDEYDAESEGPFEDCLLAQKNVQQNSVTRTLIKLSDDSGLVLPVYIVPQELIDEISLADLKVEKDCSVFSISVEKGSFRVNERTTITANKTDSDKEVEATLSYMAQPKKEDASDLDPLSSYEEEFTFTDSYIYMQVISSGNQLTSATARDFLSQLYFKRDNPSVPMKVTINLETVPSDMIKGEGDGNGGSQFKYYDGSFYTRVSGEFEWQEAYDHAKSTSFNGLQGYLMNITSLVENYYIFETFKKLKADGDSGLSWIGGSYWVPKATKNGKPWFDQETYPEVVKTYNSSGKPSGFDTTLSEVSSPSNGGWYWQSGPEAGMMFFSKKSFNTSSGFGTKDGLVWDDEKNDYVFQRWNNGYIFNGFWASNNLDKSSYPIRSNQTSAPAEPNGSEAGLQFLCGRIVNGTKIQEADGFWNNCNFYTKNNSPFASTGYIAEFTPYENDFSVQKSSYHSVRRSQVY